MDVTESMEVTELPIDQFEFSAGLYNSSIAVHVYKFAKRFWDN